MTKTFLKDEPVDIENRTNEIHSSSWKIPNFLEIIDMFSIDLNRTDNLIIYEIQSDMGKLEK